MGKSAAVLHEGKKENMRLRKAVGNPRVSQGSPCLPLTGGKASPRRTIVTSWG